MEHPGRDGLAPFAMSEGPLIEIARAKVNLSLRVLGRRDDAYHELESLVVFADIGDRLTLTPGAPATCASSGPYAGAIEGANLVQKAMAAARARWPEARLGRITLEKNLPVAAGLGGGSADAAAALRLLRAANPGLGDDAVWRAIALGLGSDVPVCLFSRAAVMRGRGERVRFLQTFPQVHAVLVNPCRPLTTAEVFGALNAPRLSGGRVAEPELEGFASQASLLDYLARNANDLEAPARRLCPPIGGVLARLKASRNVLGAGMSGSGPTCYGLFATAEEAADGAEELRKSEPGWWVAAAALN